MRTATCRPSVRSAFAVLALLVAAGAAACGGSGSTAKTAAERPAAVGSTSSSPQLSSADGLRLFRRADPDAVAVADQFLAAYNTGRPALGRFWDYSGRTSSRWADNAWLRPQCLNKDDVCPNDVERISPVMELGKFQKSDLPGQKPAPVLLAFRVAYPGGSTATWVLEFSANGQHVVNLWIP